MKQNFNSFNLNKIIFIIMCIFIMLKTYQKMANVLSVLIEKLRFYWKILSIFWENSLFMN